MITELNIAVEKAKALLEKRGICVLIEKITLSESSAYLQTDVGTIRLSDHHNEVSASKCEVFILLPVKEEHLEKMIELI